MTAFELCDPELVRAAHDAIRDIECEEFVEMLEPWEGAHNGRPPPVEFERMMYSCESGLLDTAD